MYATYIMHVLYYKHPSLGETNIASVELEELEVFLTYNLSSTGSCTFTIARQSIQSGYPSDEWNLLISLSPEERCI